MMPYDPKKDPRNWAGDDYVVTNPNPPDRIARERMLQSRKNAPLPSTNAEIAANEYQRLQEALSREKDSERQLESAKMDRFKRLSQSFGNVGIPVEEPLEIRHDKLENKNPDEDMSPEVKEKIKLESDLGQKRYENWFDKHQNDEKHKTAEYFEEFDPEGNLISRNISYPDKTFNFVKDPENPGQWTHDYTTEDGEDSHGEEATRKDPRWIDAQELLEGK
jgi:hypothetical protein